MSNSNPPISAGQLPRWWFWLAWLALAAYTAFLARNFSNVAAGADSSGYLNSARLLASGEIAAELRVPPEFGPPEKLFRNQFMPHGFSPFEGKEKLSPTYAVGLPLHLALAAKLLGWSVGPFVVCIGSAVAAVLLCYAVARQCGVQAPLALGGAAVFALYPVLVYMSLQPLSDALAAAWCLAAVATALRSRDRPAWALACGAAFSIAVLVRATNVLLLPALVVLLGFTLCRLALAVAGGLPAAAWLGYYNHQLYGGALRSGYVDIWTAFGWEYGAPTALHFAKWLCGLLPAVFLPFALFALVRPTASGRLRLALGLWFGSFFGFYSFYIISHEVWWNLRFVLPGTPALIIAGLLGLQAVATSLRAQRWIAAALVVWAVGLGWYWPKHFHLLLTKHYEHAYVEATDAARRHCPPGALVIAGHQSGALYFYTSFSVLRWELVNKSEFEAYRALATRAGRAIFALLYDIEEREALQDRCPGNWTRLEKTQNVSLWRLESPAGGAAK